jgi:hypothetical protein
LAPANVAAVVVPDLIIRLPEVLSKLPKVVPESFKNIVSPPASNMISATESKVISPEFEDANVTPVCPSIDTAPAIESTVTLPEIFLLENMF